MCIPPAPGPPHTLARAFSNSWCAPIYAEVEKARREVERKFPEHVARLTGGDEAQFDVIHGEHYAAHVYGQVLHAYFFERAGVFTHDTPPKLVRSPLEYSLANMESREGPSGDT